MMKRRVISLLSMIALLCTMVIFSMPATAVENDTNSPFEAYEELLKDAKSGAEALEQVIGTGDEAQMRLVAQAIKNRIEWVNFQWETEPFPRYAHHEVYELAGYNRNEWTLATQEDWEAMRKVADSVNATLGSKGEDANPNDYFEGVTFHLIDDINFEYEEYYAYANQNKATSYHGEDIKPMGFSVYSEGGGFAGTINGHGYSFKNVVIQALKAWLSDADGNTYENYDLCAGLFHRLADCEFIDFGLEGGIIYQNSGNANSCVSSFGNVIPGKTPSFTRVWSSITLAPICNAQATALVGSFADRAITVDVNGFVFDGEILKGSSTDHGQQLSYAIYSSSNGDFLADGNDFYNIITDFSSRNGTYSKKAVITYGNDHLGTAALFSFSSGDAFKAATIENVYAIKRKEHGIDGGYAIGSMLSSTADSNSLLYNMSAAEAAYTINNKPTENPVYFKLNDEGKVRPIPEGKSEGKIVKIVVTGDVTKNVFVNPNSTFDLKKALGYKSAVSFTDAKGDCTIEGTTVTVGNGDSTLKMINPCVDHDFLYEGNKDEMQHTGTCSNCGHQVTEVCTLTNYKSNPIAWNAMTHTGNCEKCEEEYTQNCAFEYKKINDVYKYVCSCGNQEETLAPMVAGNANNDGTIDLIDAMLVLEKAVALSDDANERNADVDGNNVVDVNDVYKIILYVIGDKATQDEFTAAEERVNEGNFFYKEDYTEVGNLKMDGTEGTNERYIRTEPISVSEGNKIVFGPIRKAQAVLGHFYDADGKAIELINVNNERLKNVRTFKAEVQGRDVEVIDYGKDAVVDDIETREVDGLEMVSITAPEGAAYVRLQANAMEEDQFYVRINNEFSLVDYQCWTNGDANALTNKENGQLFLTVGDSLCSAARDDEDSTVPKKGWEGRIRRNFGAETVDASQGGAALSTVRFINMRNDLIKEGVKPEDDELTTGDGFTLKQSIVNQINMQKDSGRAFEYILLEGGGNDASMDAKIGYYVDDNPAKGKLFNPNSYDPKDFAPIDTYMGGLEWAIYSIIKTYGDTAAIGFLLPYPMPLEDRFTDMGDYFVYTKEVCEKWDIPYLDLFYDKLKNFDTEKYTTNKEHTAPDYIHAGGTGYDIMQEYIDPFVQNEMRPANQEIYFKVQNYKDEMEVSWFELEEYKHLFE